MHALLNKIKTKFAFQLIRAADRILPSSSQVREVFRTALAQFNDWERTNAWRRFLNKDPLSYEEWSRWSRLSGREVR